MRTVCSDKENWTRRHPIKMLERPEQHHLRAARPPKCRRRTRVLPPRSAVIVVKLFIDLRRFLGECLRSSDSHRPLCAIHFSPTLFRNFGQILLEGSRIDILRETLAVRLADIIHAHRGHCLDARVGFRRSQTKATAAADADDADALTIYEWLRSQKINSGAEILNQRLERSSEMRLAATLAVVGGIVGDGDEAALGHRLCIQACA